MTLTGRVTCMVCPGDAYAGLAGWWCSLARTEKPFSHPQAGDDAEASAFPLVDKSGYRVATEAGIPVGRQREDNLQAE